MDKVKKRIKRNREFGISGFILLGVFIILLIFVVYLLFRLKEAKWEYKYHDVDFTMPVIEEKLNTINVIVGGKKKDEVVTYLFNITNYRDRKVNKKPMKYKFFVRSNTKAEYKLTLKDDDKNLLDEKNISKYLTINGKKKEIITYKLTITLKENQKKESVVDLYIEGKK